MKYENIKRGVFLERPNRFVALVEVDGEVQKAHVKNTGRCRELLVPGTTVFLQDFACNMGTRKLRYSLIGVVKKENGLLINMDSQAPNKVVNEALLSGDLTLPHMDKITLVKGEKTFGNSRFDFYLEDASGGMAFMEVKGVTLESSGVAMFPDAPTQRGVKHINELIAAKENGYNAYILFVIQMEGMDVFTPNYKTHPEFWEALLKAKASGVHILARQCKVGEDSLILDGSEEIRIDLEPSNF